MDFLLNELSLSISTFSWNKTLGQAFPVSSTPTLDDEIKDGESFNSAAEILVHPSGRWVYSSNRGHDSVSVFQRVSREAHPHTSTASTRSFPKEYKSFTKWNVVACRGSGFKYHFGS